MAVDKYPRILPMYYDPAHDLQAKRPRATARRACGDVAGLAADFELIADRFSSDLRYRYLDDVARRLAFDYEDYLHRVHSVRERSWDVLTGLSTHGQILLRDCDPRRLGTPRSSRDRETLVSEIRTVHPDLHDAFTRPQAQIENNTGMRNVATHQTFIWIALMPDENDAREINDYDFPADGNEAERGARKVVRKLLRGFVAERKSEIAALIGVARPFAETAQAACA